MTIDEHVSEFAGKRVIDWEQGDALADPNNTIYRIRIEYNDDVFPFWTDKFAAFLDMPGAGEISGLVVGIWGYEGGTSELVIEALVAAHERLPRLSALFIGDITFDENEMSWIGQSDVSPIFIAYPALEHFRVRGGNGLRLGTLHHERLKSLAIETGGLDASIVHEVQRAHLPALEHLELWLGDEGYGANTTVEDFAPLLSGQLFPNLRYLGLRNSEIVDDLTGVLAVSPLLERIRVLDLSLGTLSDRGAAALLNCPAVRNLEKLDIHHHYCSEAIVLQLQCLGVEVDVRDAHAYEDDDGQRFVAVGE